MEATSDRLQAAVTISVKLKVVLQTIHWFHNPFSQSQRRPFWLKVPTIAFTFKTLLRHYAMLCVDPAVSRCEIGSQTQKS